MLALKINSVQDLRDSISGCLNQASLDIETESIQDSIKRIKRDILFNEIYVLRFDLNSVRLYDISDGNVLTIPTELIAAFSLLEKNILYMNLTRVREELLRKIIPVTGAIRDDYEFITNFIDLFDFCNSINHLAFTGENNKNYKDITRIIADLDRLDTGLILGFLSSEAGINSIQPIHINSLKYGDKYI